MRVDRTYLTFGGQYNGVMLGKSRMLRMLFWKMIQVRKKEKSGRAVTGWFCGFL